ncbi:Uncharacterised protein [Streptococcus pneumoniae]|nr:Uncharacterised protein [Streptococcus pneumoniae]VQW58651.1 Uncharacterised protein [Streptococcus pneumoniae]VRB43721.1 Uncharacterised protein [Streptococcus pneumoniae]
MVFRLGVNNWGLSKNEYDKIRNKLRIKYTK